MHARFALALCAFLAVGLLAFGPALADDGPATTDDAHQRMVGLLSAFADFSKGVRLTEGDVKKIIEVHGSFDKLDDGDNEDWIEKAWVDGKVDFDALFKNEKYVAWAKQSGVDPKGFFGTMTRLQLLHMQQTQLKNLEESASQIAGQLAQIEAMRAHMGEEAYQQAKKSIEAGVAMIQSMLKTLKAYPAASEGESLLLKQYEAPLKKVFGEDDEDTDEPMDDEDDDGDE